MNTLFFFRPTESATVFLQQLGRGLKRTPTKAELVVFDLTARNRFEFRFDRRLRALLGSTARELRDLVSDGTGLLPTGCYMHFDPLAKEDVLAQLRRSIPSDISGIRALLREPAHARLGLAEFLRETDVELADLYANGRSWTLLRRDVGLDTRALDDQERLSLSHVHKLIHVGDETRLSEWERLARLERSDNDAGRRLVAMLFVALYGSKLALTDEAWQRWSTQEALRREIAEIVPVLRARNALLVSPHSLDDRTPLRLHASYLSGEVGAAFDARTADGGLRPFYTGVETVADGRFDLIFVTLQKSAATKEHLKYRDFPLNEWRFHWQSKAATTRESRLGRRHLRPTAERCTALLFVRVRDDDRPPFQYLGPVVPDGDDGERPISITWKLAYAMPAALVQRGRIAA